MKKGKPQVVTFKVDEALWESLKDIPNRSEFIRSAVMTAMENVCPLCLGTGILTPKQKEHWAQFARDHAVEECEDCHERRLVCTRK